MACHFFYTADFEVQRAGKNAFFQMASRAMKETDNITISVIENRTSVYDQDFISNVNNKKSDQQSLFREPFFLFGKKNAFCQLPTQFAGIYDYVFIISHDKDQQLSQDIHSYLFHSNFIPLDAMSFIKHKDNSAFFYKLSTCSEYYCINGKNIIKQKILGKTKTIPENNLKKDNIHHHGTSINSNLVVIEDQYYALLSKDISFE
ncbi:MAG: hypothetical protein LBU51_05325 [Bacteroidales bacterium]|nr:hypothetical protein [Bacteroidales bacterium]